MPSKLSEAEKLACRLVEFGRPELAIIVPGEDRYASGRRGLQVNAVQKPVVRPGHQRRNIRTITIKDVDARPDLDAGLAGAFSC
jgi:hypothetical protein